MHYKVEIFVFSHGERHLNPKLNSANNFFYNKLWNKKKTTVGVLRNTNFSPTLWLKKLYYIYFRYIKLIFWQNLFFWSFSAYFHSSKPTEAAAKTFWSARWRHFQPIRGRLFHNPLSRNTPPPLFKFLPPNNKWRRDGKPIINAIITTHLKQPCKRAQIFS